MGSTALAIPVVEDEDVTYTRLEANRTIDEDQSEEMQKRHVREDCRSMTSPRQLYMTELRSYAQRISGDVEFVARRGVRRNFAERLNVERMDAVIVVCDVVPLSACDIVLCALAIR
ncbi:hypothetical protein Tco_0256667 [Tanacetum coccineum]